MKATGFNNVTPNAQLTTTNHGGTTLDVLSPTATAVMVQAAPTPYEGASCLTTTAPVTMYYDVAARTKVMSSYFVYVPSGTFTADQTLGGEYYTTTVAGTVVILAFISGGYRLRLATRGSGTQTTRWTDAVAVPTNAWFRVDHYAESGTSATTGAARVALFDVPSSATPRSGSDSSLITGVDTAGTTGAFVRSRLGVGATYALDSWRTKDQSDGVTAFAAWPLTSAPAVHYTQTNGLMFDFTTSTGSAPFTYGIAWVSGPNHLTDIDQPVNGIFIIPQDATGPSVYAVTVTDATTLFTVQNITVPSLQTAGDSFQTLIRTGGVLL